MAIDNHYNTGGVLGEGYDYAVEVRNGTDVLVARYFLYGVPIPLLPPHIVKWGKAMTDNCHIVIVPLKRVSVEGTDDESLPADFHSVDSDPKPIFPGMLGSGQS